MVKSSRLRHPVALCLGLVAFCLVGTGQTGDAPSNVKDIPSQAQPIHTWLQAVKNGDLERLKTVFSKRMRERFEKEGWDYVLKTYQALFKAEFGDYKLEEFVFTFTGGEEKGEYYSCYAFHFSSMRDHWLKTKTSLSSTLERVYGTRFVRYVSLSIKTAQACF